MEFGGKNFEYYWKIIKYPVFVIIGYSLLGFIISLVSYQTYISIFSNISGIFLGIIVFAFVGWTTVKDHKGSIKESAWAGVLTGVISGCIGGIISVLMFYLVPQVIQDALAKAAQQGANPDMVSNFMKIGVYIGIVVAILINAVLGAVISAITALIAQKVK